MAVTIKDVARKLNLSIATVSRALDGFTDISFETRQRVANAAEEMGYIPNRAAIPPLPLLIAISVVLDRGVRAQTIRGGRVTGDVDADRS